MTQRRNPAIPLARAVGALGLGLGILLGPPAAALEAGTTVRGGAEMGLQASAADGAWSVATLQFEAAAPGVALALAVPLRVGIGTAPHLRQRDWDEPGDFAHILRRLELRSASESAQLQAGELAGVTLGHGALVRRFYNMPSPDHGRLGLRATVRTDDLRADALVDDIVQAEILAARLELRPWSGRTGLPSLRLGFSVAADRVAPWITSQEPGRTLDASGFVQAPRLPVVAGALDAAVDFWHGPRWRAALALDLGLVGGNAKLSTAADRLDAGASLGPVLRWEGAGRSVEARADLRWLGGAWSPGWIDAAYGIERFQVLDGGPVRSALAARIEPARLARKPWGAGGRLDVVARGWGRASLDIDWSAKDAGAVGAWWVGEERAGLQTRAWLVRKGLAAALTLADLGPAVAGVGLRYRATGPFYAAFGLSRRWQETMNAATGPQVPHEPGVASAGARLAGVTEWSATVGFDLRR
ncbi:MAG: hypothetical protein EXR79_03400 [Myxococcales bacterium]|nr:hypothetical protein [Myxococcales bacterium]